MKPVMIKLQAAIAATALFGGSALAASDGKKAPHGDEWVAEKAKVCASCHGENGISKIPANPTLAGQHRDYLLHSLKGYRDGTRKNPIMGAQVSGLTDAQLKALAAYYSKQKGPLGLVKTK